MKFGKRKHFALVSIAAALGLVSAAILLPGATNVLQPRHNAFARPNFDVEIKAPALDLTRKWSGADRDLFDKLAADESVCREALSAVGVRLDEAAPIAHPNGCGFDSAIQVAGMLSQLDATSTMTCALAARLYLWERDVVEPAAIRHLGAAVSGTTVLGTYSCRKVDGSYRLSQHAFGKAIDIGGFSLVDGRKISVLKDFRKKGPKQDFLREIHDRACEMFDVTLGPDFNADHANHFHLDIGGESACR